MDFCRRCENDLKIKLWTQFCFEVELANMRGEISDKEADELSFAAQKERVQYVIDNLSMDGDCDCS